MGEFKYGSSYISFCFRVKVKPQIEDYSLFNMTDNKCKVEKSKTIENAKVVGDEVVRETHEFYTVEENGIETSTTVHKKVLGTREWEEKTVVVNGDVPTTTINTKMADQE